MENKEKQFNLYYDLKKVFSDKFKRDRQKINYYKDKIKKLDPDEYLTYLDFVERLPKASPLFWLIAPFKLAFYLGIFSLVMLFAFEISLFDPLKIIIGSIFSLYIFLILIALLELLMVDVTNKKKCENFIDRF